MGSRKWDRDNKGIKPPAKRQPRARLGTNWMLPRLRVRPDSEGRFIEALPPRPYIPGGDEGWWQAVMNDWRRPRQTHHRFDRLGEHRGPVVVIACEECNLRREFQTADLLRMLGPDYRMVYLRYDIAKCPAGKEFKDCGIRYPRS